MNPTLRLATAVVYGALLVSSGCRTLPTPPDAKKEVKTIQDTTDGITKAAAIIEKSLAEAKVALAKKDESKVAESIKSIEAEVARAGEAVKALTDSSNSLTAKSDKASEVVTGLQDSIKNLELQLDTLQKKYTNDMKDISDKYTSEINKTKAAYDKNMEQTVKMFKTNEEKLVEEKNKLKEELDSLKNKHTAWLFTWMIIIGSVSLASSLILGIYVKPQAGFLSAIAGISLVGTGWALQTWAPLLGKIAFGAFVLAIVIALGMLIYYLVKNRKALEEVVAGLEHAKGDITSEDKEKIAKSMEIAQTTATEEEVAAIRKSEMEKAKIREKNKK